MAKPGWFTTVVVAFSLCACYSASTPALTAESGLRFPVTFVSDCRSEICRGGSWIACQATTVRYEPRHGSPAIAQLSAGDSFHVTRSGSVVLAPGVVRVLSDIPVIRNSADMLAAGDTVLLLDYRGEGVFAVSHRRRITEAEVFWPWEKGPHLPRNNAGEVLKEQQSEHWLGGMTKAGYFGWVLNEPATLLDPLQHADDGCS
jgi:hypothetical protein